MSPATSVVLDLLRFFLALVVAFGHLTLNSIQDGWQDLTRFSLIAVGGFFVLSGYIIRMITLRVHDAASVRAYFTDRAARLLSITWPALVLTLLCTWVASRAAPDFFERAFFEGADQPVLRYALSAALYTQPYGLDLAPQANSPLWSLGYEAGFYVIWGALLAGRVYGRGPLLIAAALVFYGPHVAIMFPCWLLGVLLYDQTAHARERGTARKLALLGAAGACAFGLALALFHAQLANAWHTVVGGGMAALGMDRGRLALSYVIGALACYVGLLTVLPLLDLSAARWSPPASVVRWSRRIGEATFPLYAIHMPLFALAASLALYDRGSSAQKLSLLGGVIALSLALVPVGNVLKRRLAGLTR